MTNKRMNICVVDTVYTLFLYFLIFGYNEEDFFIFSEGMPKVVKDNISHYSFPSIRFNFDNDKNFIKINLTNIKQFFKHFFSILKLRTVLFFKTRNKEVYVYGHGHLSFSFPLYEFENNALIEDGIANYLNLVEPTRFNPIIQKFFNFLSFYSIHLEEGLGTHENIKKIYLTRNDVPEIIKHKVEVINPDELWKSKSHKEQLKILELFHIDFLDNFDEDSTLLLTEPFSEEEIIPFEEEINIYKSIIDVNEQIIIKTHPREKKDYRSIFPNIEVINVPFPVELLKYVGINLKKIITFGSTAALSFEGYCEIEVYDKETSSERINQACALLKEKLK